MYKSNNSTLSNLTAKELNKIKYNYNKIYPHIGAWKVLEFINFNFRIY